MSSSETVNYSGKISSPSSPPVLNCSAISVYNDGSVSTKWDLISVATGKKIYTSGSYFVGGTWKKSLASLSITAGTQLILHASVAGKDSEAYAILQYTPTSSTTATFTLGGNAFITVTMYGNPRK